LGKPIRRAKQPQLQLEKSLRGRLIGEKKRRGGAGAREEREPKGYPPRVGFRQLAQARKKDDPTVGSQELKEIPWKIGVANYYDITTATEDVTLKMWNKGEEQRQILGADERDRARYDNVADEKRKSPGRVRGKSNRNKKKNTFKKNPGNQKESVPS